MAEKSREADRAHVLFVVNFIVMCTVFVLIASDVCGKPYWYGRREHPPVTPDGRLQFLSEHIMRCKYRTGWYALPWVTLYLFAVQLVQTAYTWARLNMVMLLQNAHLTGTRGTVLRPTLHTGFVVVLGMTLLGLIAVVKFDHDYVPENLSDRAGARPIVLVDRSFSHFFGVMILIGGYLLLHLLIIYVYTVRIFSSHDYTCMCDGPALDSCTDRPAMIWWGLYIGSEGVYAVLLCLFALLVALGMNAGAVTTEYVLLLAFLCLVAMDLLVSYRVMRWYRIWAI